MKILCLVKFTPDVDAMEYDPEKGGLRREGIKQIINPDDACALGYALALKKKHPQVEIEVLSMAPQSAIPLMEDILRRRVERGTLLSDKAFAGSDSYATARILAAYLKTADYDVILTGDHSIDGDTAHIPGQLAEILGLDQISGVKALDDIAFLSGIPLLEVETETSLETYEVQLPAIISICRASRIRLPFVRFADLHMPVADRLQILNGKALGLEEDHIGLAASPTRVIKTWPKTYESKGEQVVVGCDAQGVETVYQFLKGNGYLS